MDAKRLTDTVSVSPQITPEDVPAIKAAGFVAIVNNRPDGEAQDQPAGAEIEAAAREAGLAYHAIPLGREGVTPEMIAATGEVLENAGGPVLCYCRTGTRSTNLWALSQAGKAEPDRIVAQAAEAGYDISGLAGQLRRH